MPYLIEGTPSDVDATPIPLPDPPTPESQQILGLAEFREPADADDSPAFVRMFDEIDTRLANGEQVRLVDLRGYHELSEPLEIRGDGLRFLGPATFVAMEHMTHVLGISARNSVFSGPLVVKGGPASSGQSYIGRRATVGVLLRQSHSSSFDFVKVDGVKRDGVLVEAIPTNFAMLTDFRRLKTNHCGSAFGGVALAEVSFPFTARVDTTGATGQGANSVAQSSKLTCTPHVDLQTFDLVIIDDDFYFVTELDATSITVFPWLDPGVNAGTIISAHGAGLRTIGGNAGGITAVQDSTLCGVGTAICSLYGPQIQIQAHACAVGVQVGYKPGDGPNGFGIHGFYTEDDVLVKAPIVKVARSCSGEVDGTQALNLDKIISLSPKNTSGAIYSLYEGLDGIQITYEGASISERRGNRGIESPTVFGSNHPKNNHLDLLKNNVSVKLQYHPGLDRLARASTLTVDAWGGTGTGPGSVTFLIDTAQDPSGTVGNTQGGGASLAHNPTGPTRYVLMRARTSTDWVVTAMPLTRL